MPYPPAYLKPIAVPPATPGSNVFVVSQRRADAIERQNTVITRTYDAWIDMKKTYSTSFAKRSIFGR